ncbi:hypothetical protein [Streptomyces malaysiensis]|uniref:hypothetical protein n=1 Tax=Streptomyces malaysiensis TaxID=92644 RepID=UPI00142EBC74|nr:hypothetical protein [Streptomyces malaysiensis]
MAGFGLGRDVADAARASGLDPHPVQDRGDRDRGDQGGDRLAPGEVDHQHEGDGDRAHEVDRRVSEAAFAQQDQPLVVTAGRDDHDRGDGQEERHAPVRGVVQLVRPHTAGRIPASVPPWPWWRASAFSRPGPTWKEEDAAESSSSAVRSWKIAYRVLGAALWARSRTGGHSCRKCAILDDVSGRAQPAHADAIGDHTGGSTADEQPRA